MANATYDQLQQIAATFAFQQRVKLAVLLTAQDVYTEVNTVTGHAARALFATKVLLNTGDDLSTLAMTVLITSTTIIAEANPDADISNAVSAIWNSMAGA